MILDIHPFMKSFNSGSLHTMIPPQMIPMSDKYKDKDKRHISPWMRRCMDYFESVGRIQYQQNLKLVNNERLVNGEFIPEDYVYNLEDEQIEEYLDPLVELSKDGGLPPFMKHYDMISTPIKTQVEEFTQMPDTMHVVAKGDVVDNDRFVLQKELLMNWINESMDLQFNKILQASNIDPDQKFNSEEEQQQFDQKLAELRQEKTPEEIGRYMKYDFRHFAEEWAEYELEEQKERFKLHKLRRREFLNYLTVGRRFREIVTTATGFTVQPLNYKNIFFHTNKDLRTEYIQYGDFVGKIYIDTPSGIVNRFRGELTEEEIRSFEYFANNSYQTDKPGKDLFGNVVTYTDVDNNPYGKWMPTMSPFLNKVAPNLGMNWITNSVSGFDGLPFSRYFVVTEVYWRSFKKVGRLCWKNPESGILEVKDVDESFVIPDFIKELKDGTFVDEPVENTIIWSYIEEIWQGKKVNNYNIDKNRAPIYFSVKPCDYQGHNKYEYFQKPLPIVGQVANNINTVSSTQIDILKPYQFLYNIVMNKAFRYIQKSLAAFVALDIKTIANQKDYAGVDGLFKWLDLTQEGIAPMDTSPSNTQGANAGGQLPKVIDVDNTKKAIEHFNMASAIKALGLSQIGIIPERLGDGSQIDTASGLQASVARSYNATGSWFTEFWECEAEILRQQLEVAQWLQSKNKDFTALINKGVISNAFLANNSDNFSLYDLNIFISNSKEELRQLELYKKLALENNTVITRMSTRMQMVGLNNADIILNIVKSEEEKMLELQQKQRELELQMEQAKNDLEIEKLNFEREKLDKELQNNLDEAFIRAYGHSQKAGEDTDGSGIPDMLEYQKFEETAQNNLEKLNIDKSKHSLDKQKEFARQSEKRREFELKIKELQLKKEQLAQTAKNVKILDKGTYKGK